MCHVSAVCVPVCRSVGVFGFVSLYNEWAVCKASSSQCVCIVWAPYTKRHVKLSLVLDISLSSGLR